MTVQIWKLETGLGRFGFIWDFLIIIFERGMLQFKQKISQKTERMALQSRSDWMTRVASSDLPLNQLN